MIWTDHNGTELRIYDWTLRVSRSNVLALNVTLPEDDVKRLRLAESVLGRPILDINPPRKVAAVIFEDELPEVILPGSEDEAIKVGSGPESCSAMPDDNPNWLLNHAAGAVALARHIEAQDAERAQAEREQQQQVDTLAQALSYEYRDADGLIRVWDELAPAAQNSWRAVARKVIADEATRHGTESAKAGVRAPQGGESA